MTSDATRILVIDDEEAIREAVASALRDRGHVVRTEADGRAFLGVVRQFRPDLALLDIMLPGRDGLGLARDLVAEPGERVPVIFLTARDTPADVVRGFDCGADDYIVKPFHLEELQARVTALLRRSGRAKSAVLAIDDLIVDEAAGTVERGGEPIEVTATELRLLLCLMRTPGRVLSKTQILGQVWGYESYDPNLVEVHVSSLRRKLEADGRSRLLHTIRGLGYTIKPVGR